MVCRPSVQKRECIEEVLTTNAEVMREEVIEYDREANTFNLCSCFWPYPVGAAGHPANSYLWMDDHMFHVDISTRNDARS